jgi:hypothetical protein
MDKKRYYTMSETNSSEYFFSNILQQSKISNAIKWILLIMNETQRYNINIERCINKFNIGQKEKGDLIMWLLDKKYPHSKINDISKLINYKGEII